ncbi:hypothetical protein GCM10025853_30750 [Tetragenococcus halophilus subsp. halophilus DSM 20339]|nr:hypothetical protein GCM10025853_30750 [Tetragenococcus halophilus subsp. halophilus DSM 20339]
MLVAFDSSLTVIFLSSKILCSSKISKISLPCHDCILNLKEMQLFKQKKQKNKINT